MKKMHIFEFLSHPSDKMYSPKLVNLRGCNGAGKSTIPHQMIQSDPSSFELFIHDEPKDRIIATVCPKYQFLLLGHYHVKSGGLDTISTTQKIKDLTAAVWNCNYHILMEGVVASTVRQTYIDLFKELNQSKQVKREIVIYNIVPPLKVCLERIQQRNGGKPIKEFQVESKWKSIRRNIPYFHAAAFTTLTVDNSDIPVTEALPYFFGQINLLMNAFPYKFQDAQSVQTYEWETQAREPTESLDIDQKYFDIYWYFIAERMNIWYKRVVLNQPPPWTDDPILQQYKFTNVIRDLDRLSIWERKHILQRIDEPTKNLELRKKSVLLNIMIFRLWVKIDTYEVHGFIDLEQPDWRHKWNSAKQMLLDRREQGISNFTAAYYVNDLHAANPDQSKKGNKTYSAICLIDSWIQNIDEIYHYAIVESRNMTEQMEYFQTLICIGDFTAYEWACSIAEITRYCHNHLVEWTQDNATNVGPGAKRGINWIFKDKGGMTDYQCILWLRSRWKQELQKRGTYERFISQLPKEMNGDIDLRVIEHCLCETQKYNKALNNTGRPKEMFKPKDISDLRQ